MKDVNSLWSVGLPRRSNLFLLTSLLPLVIDSTDQVYKNTVARKIAHLGKEDRVHMPDLADVFAILQTVDCETLYLVRSEVDRLQREKQNERRERVELGVSANVVRRCA
jgi:hypothetical protein